MRLKAIDVRRGDKFEIIVNVGQVVALREDTRMAEIGSSVYTLTKKSCKRLARALERGR